MARTIPPTQLRANFDTPAAINRKREKILWGAARLRPGMLTIRKRSGKGQNALIDLEQMRNEFKSLRVKYLGSEHSEFHCDQGAVWRKWAHSLDLAPIHFLDRNPNFFVERNHRLCSLVLPDLPLSSQYFAASWKRILTKLTTNKIRGRANMASKISIRLRNCAIFLTP